MLLSLRHHRLLLLLLILLKHDHWMHPAGPLLSMVYVERPSCWVHFLLPPSGEWGLILMERVGKRLIARCSSRISLLGRWRVSGNALLIAARQWWSSRCARRLVCTIGRSTVGRKRRVCSHSSTGGCRCSADNANVFAFVLDPRVLFDGAVDNWWSEEGIPLHWPTRLPLEEINHFGIVFHCPSLTTRRGSRDDFFLNDDWLRVRPSILGGWRYSRRSRWSFRRHRMHRSRTTSCRRSGVCPAHRIARHHTVDLCLGYYLSWWLRPRLHFAGLL